MVFVRALGIGLSFVFGGFVLVLLAELYYMLFWKKPRSSSNWKTNNDRPKSAEMCSSAQEAAFVDSFGGSSRLPSQSELMAKFFSAYPSDLTSPERFQFYAASLLLFPITEETNEDMESEDAKFKGNAVINRACTRISSDALARFSSESSPPEDPVPLTTPASSPSLHSPRIASPLTPRNDSRNSSLSRFAARAVQPTSVSMTKSPGGIAKEAVPFASCSKGHPTETHPDALVLSPYSSPSMIPSGTPTQPAGEQQHLQAPITMPPVRAAPDQCQKLPTQLCYRSPHIVVHLPVLL